MVRPKTILQWPDTFVEHLTGAPGEANEELFHYLIATLPPRQRDAVMLHFHDCFPYRIVGEKMGTKDGHTGEKISVSRAMQLAEMGVRRIRERIAMDTGIVPFPVDKPEYGETLRQIIAGTVEDYHALITAKQQRKVEAEARALEMYRADSISILDLTLPTQRTLVKANITSVGQLAGMTEEDLLALGYVNIENIRSRLGTLGIRLKKASSAE